MIGLGMDLKTDIFDLRYDFALIQVMIIILTIVSILAPNIHYYDYCVGIILIITIEISCLIYFRILVKYDISLKKYDLEKLKLELEKTKSEKSEEQECLNNGDK